MANLTPANLTRRSLLNLGAASGALWTLRAAVKPVRITDVDLFRINIPVGDAEAAAGVMHDYEVVKVMTDAGSFRLFVLRATPTRAAGSKGGAGWQGPLQYRRAVA